MIECKGTYCYCREIKHYKVVHLVFIREQLIYDIDNCSWVEGDVLRAEDEHQRHQIQDVAQYGNIDRVTRMLDLAFAECNDILYPFTKTKLEAGTREDDTLKETEKYVMRLKVPRDFSKTTYEVLLQYIHHYMVARVIEDWMSITNPDKNSAANWKRKIEEVREAIESAMNSRMGRVRRTLTPW